MKKTIKTAAVALMALLSLQACRKESDMFHNYSYESALAFGGADRSFGEKFKVLWEGLNSNYALWDYEERFDLDWDDVYDTYYPKFVELDTLALKRKITTRELTDLLTQVVGPLHDGRLAVDMKNHTTDSIASVNPGYLRVGKERQEEMKDLETFTAPSLLYYELKGIAKEVKTTDATDQHQYLASRDSALNWANREIDRYAAKTVLTAEELGAQRLAQDLRRDLEALDKISDNKQVYAAFNKVALRYAYLGIPGFYVLDETLLDNSLRLTSAILNGNIAYLNLSNFTIGPYLTTLPAQAKDLEPYAAALVAEMKATWEAWFGTIQELHKTGKLGGVIIDLRCNGGGLMTDFQYVLGALLPSGGYHAIDNRAKRGVGRYDYSPLTPQIMPTYEGEHVTVTEPVAVLVNCKSVSMSEVTSISTRRLDNVKLVGTRTWGGLCGIVGNTEYDYTYAGHIGVEGKTPVYVYCPSIAAFDVDGNVLEGVGITPDIEVPLDLKAWNKGVGADNQLDRAIEYIVSGK